MSNKLKERLMSRTANLADSVAATARPSITEQRPQTMPGQLGAFRLEAQRYQKRIEDLEAELQAAKENGGVVELPIDKLHEVPGRRRYMPPVKYAELRENLRHNPLVNPVVVITREDGEWDIWSGHHRWDSYKELGRATVPCVLRKVSSETEASDGAFFANLMQSDLTDYEKFVGLRKFHAGHPDLTQTEVAERTGLSKQFVSELYAFERLPAEALSIIEGNKSMIGASAVAELATLATDGKAPRVVEAIRLLADKKLDQSQAIKFARTTDAPKAPAAQSETFRVKAGKTTWCDVRRVKNVMRIEFKTEAQANAVQEAIRLHLMRLAEESCHHPDD